ncbi:GPI transamidase component PIG-T [Schistosoma japonicum]|uniref:GPI transamidase component PIG-T n=2 Tax=Schistosoma japonicum TaxID=6182 RepID=A0A4Z2DIA8_SCHJA|nr:GPI transamidase component PIG-T [Schistosoma japonicum]
MSSFYLLAFLVFYSPIYCENFDEELLIKDLGHGYTAFHFNFAAITSETVFRSKHYNILPKSIIQIVEKYSVNEFHLSISRGIWDERWGSNFVSVSPSGAELWAWFGNQTSNVDQSWFELTHALSGLFCASLNRLSTSEHFTSPVHSYKPLGVSEFGKVFGEIRYSQLPGEALCSENLTPWTKYLPCKSFVGLGSLLRPTSLFKSNYNTMTIGVRRICLDLECYTVGLELTETLTVVFDRSLMFPKITSPWSIKSILSSELRGTCDAANSSRVFILTSYENTNLPSHNVLKIDYPDSRVLGAYLTKDLPPLFTSFPFATTEKKSTWQHLPLVSATKHITGSGNVRGGVKALLTSRADFHMMIVYFDLIPWYAQVFFSSLRIYCLDPKTQNKTVIIPHWLVIKPGLARKRMASIELIITLPALSQVIITYEFRKVLQRWNEFPPDANHGFFLPAATVSYALNNEQLNYINKTKHAAFQNLNLPNWASSYNQYFVGTPKAADARPGDGFVRLHTPVSLVTMPTPDFSMPFNVLCLVCSVIAVVFGSVHKATTTVLNVTPQVTVKDPIWKRLTSRILTKVDIEKQTFQFQGIKVQLHTPVTSSPNYGHYTWKCAEVLSGFLARYPEEVRGLRVLELGAGTGLCGITAAVLGALHVRFTDKDLTCLETLRLNAQLNGINNYDFILLDWNYPLDWPGGLFDVILASDCLYDKEVYEPFLKTATLQLRVNNNASLLLAFENRSSFADITTLFKKYDLKADVLNAPDNAFRNIYILRIRCN